MSSISIRFALASVSVALLILALTGGINYLFLKKELLEDATQKAELIEKNSRYKIDSLFSRAEKRSEKLKAILLESNLSEASIKEHIREVLKEEDSFFGMTLAFKPTDERAPFSPFYYKKESKILYRDLASKEYDYLKKDWYKTPIEQERSLWSEPYYDEGGGDILMATFSNPIVLDGEVIAILTIDISLEEIQDMVLSIEVLDSGYAFMLSSEHKIIAHPDKSLIMQVYDRPFSYYNMIKEEYLWRYYVPVQNTSLTLVIIFPIDELFASLHYMSIIYILLASIGAIMLTVTMIVISRRVTGPLRELIYVTDEIARGNFDKKISLPRNCDEIYKLSYTIETMQKAIVKYIEDLRSATIEQQKIDSELDIAKSIQMSMLPKNLPHSSIKLQAMLKPAKAVGGDFYDFFFVDDEHLCFAVADVSGKGVPAAMFMSVTMSYLRAYSRIGLSASELVTKLNNTIASNNDANMFVTIFLGILNVKNGRLNYVNAGHNEPYLLMGDDEHYKRIQAVGNTVVGAIEGLKYRDETIFLERDSKLFLYTDGVTEAFSKEDETFGDIRLSQVLNEVELSNPDEVIQTIEKVIKEFAFGCEQSDDITMLHLEFSS